MRNGDSMRLRALQKCGSESRTTAPRMEGVAMEVKDMVNTTVASTDIAIASSLACGICCILWPANWMSLHANVFTVAATARPTSDAELKTVGEYGLRNKREVWRVMLTLSKIRRAARQLLTLDEKDPKRLFEGNALIRRLVRVGVLDESRMKLDYVLALKVEDFLERRLQTCVYKLGLAKSIHHARVLIRQRHIRVGKQIVNVPSFIVRLDSQKHIDFALTSPFGGGRPGRVRRKKAKAAEKGEEGGEGGDEEEE
ncbi:hypothetical protein BT93_L5485 [Corymbia citriodora subsp. variegata]|uniref:40S ribosomal protein S9 n=1 Tax=Corymbia citriodora subsp. variegata TaxID=360336 RepID=A0A8T0CH21_CORYI|nr:hypothetical protein BT93_L5485 [Corymbia citriodora subsp. variegata]